MVPQISYFFLPLSLFVSLNPHVNVRGGVPYHENVLRYVNVHDGRFPFHGCDHETHRLHGNDHVPLHHVGK